MKEARINFPATPDDVTANWLNSVLSGSSEWNLGDVESLVASPLGGLDSLASEVQDVRVITTSGRRERLLVKLHIEGKREAYVPFYAAEASFYNNIGERAGVPIPTTFFAGWDPASRRLAVVQEFLEDGRPGSMSESISIPQADIVLDTLASMHARWWNSQELELIPGIRHANPARRWVVESLEDRVDSFLLIFGDQLDAPVRRLYETLPIWFPLLGSQYSRNYTLTHMDCSSKNIFFPADSSKCPVFFDWGFFHIGPSVNDAAVLCCISLDIPDQPEVKDLIGRYHQKLTSLGVSDYPFDMAWKDFQLACLRRGFAPVINSTMGEPERLHHSRIIFDGIVSALVVNECLEVAEEIVMGARRSSSGYST